MLAERSKRKRLLLIGLESVGKTTLFSRWTQFGIGEETNVKGTTYMIRSHPIRRLNGWEVVDTPGLRRGDELGKRQLKKEVAKADHVMLVVRGTHFMRSWKNCCPSFLLPKRTSPLPLRLWIK